MNNIILHVLNFLAPPTTEQVVKGCSHHDECPDYNACENTICINPCAVRNPCAPLATCKVVNHNPVCTCPDGYVGSPETLCTQRKFFVGMLHYSYNLFFCMTLHLECLNFS